MVAVWSVKESAPSTAPSAVHVVAEVPGSSRGGGGHLAAGPDPAAP
ncbi:hypothetical protein [Actinophytocola sp.]